MFKAEIIGHIGADVVKKNVDGREFITFRVAHTDSYTDASNNVHSDTTWIDVVLYRGDNILPYLKKGTQVYVRGSVSCKLYDSQKDKCKKISVQVRCDEIQLLSSKRDESFTSNTENNGDQGIY